MVQNDTAAYWEEPGIPAIYRVIKRHKKAKQVDQIWLDTTKKEEDNVFENIAKKFKINVFRGSINNVLSRFEQISNLSKGTNFVRVTADCPLIDFNIIDKAIHICIKKKIDYVSNTIERTFPDGLDVEVFSKEALSEVGIKTPFQEHVTHIFTGKYLNL